MIQMNLQKRAGSAWARVNTSRFTVLYIVFIGLFSIAQIGLRAQVFVLDSGASRSLETILVAGRATSSRFPVLGSDSSIRLCEDLPMNNDDDSCQTVWDASSGQTHILVPRDDPALIADRTCLMSLNYPVSVLRSDLREDVVSIALQLFSLIIAVVALTQKHLSHFVTGVILQVMSCVWAAIRVSDTGKSASDFQEAIVNGACGGQLLGNFWSRRWGFDVAVLAVDVLSLMATSFFTWRAAQNLGVTQLKSAALSSSTNRAYKALISALVVIELSLFFSVAAGILWIDEVFYLNGATGLGLGAKVLFLIAEVLMIPVLFLGWVALHREMWKSVLIFLGCSFVYTAGWGLCFVLQAFRYTINSWRLFGCLSIVSFILAFSSFTLSVVVACYFGTGMTQISKGTNSGASSSDLIRSGSISSLEKGIYVHKELHVDSFDEKITVAMPTLAYTPRMPKAKAAAIARGLSVTPPPLNY